MIKVTITECKSEGRVWAHGARTDDYDEAAGRVIKRVFGARAGPHVDHGLTCDQATRYGQIVVPGPMGGWDCITGRVRIDLDEG